MSNTKSPRFDSLYYHSIFELSLEKISEHEPKPPLDDLPKLEQNPIPSHEKVQVGNKGQDNYGTSG